MAPGVFGNLESTISEPKPVISAGTPGGPAEQVSFGGDDQWWYNPETKQFDLSRGAAKKLQIDADDGIRNHRGVLIDPEKTALIVIDMQNYFIHPECCHHPGGLAAVAPTLKVIERCREENIQVVFVNWGITEEDLRRMPPAVTRGFNRNLISLRGYGWNVNLGSQLPGDQGRCLFKGTWNADIYDPLKAVMVDNDLRFDKARMSGLWSPELPFHKYLQESGKKTLLFTGVNTDQCLLGTLTDAYSWGWDCILISDCAATLTELNAHDVAIHNISTNLGFVCESTAFTGATRFPQ
ncbi:MAG: hypothetical protein M1821_002787 [Bathelium mastoideum]|nr:MAG: hypothetical protein M1821_002787 [Bathelium mastoideum]